VNIKIPDEAQYIINRLEESGYEAYVAGGCVRDAVLETEPKDWDICTQALPEQTMKCFEGQRIIETGLRHGTITLVLDHKPFEITTYRVDGTYSDNRHPDTVEFVKDLKEDLARRDFTINAMAYNPKTGIVDFFGGQEDIKDGIIRCVGDADKRFQEDALRIMRALRFAAVLGFTIEKNTSNSCIGNRQLLQNIAVERIAVELNQLIVGKGVFDVLRTHTSVLTEIIPEMIPMVGFDQNTAYHCFDVFQHTLRSVAYAPSDVVIRLTMLFHDIAKPKCYHEDERGGHFYGHAQAGAEMAREILQRLKYDNDTIETVTQLILYHGVELHPESKSIKRWLNRIGEVRLRQLIEVKRADAMAKADQYRQGDMDALDRITATIDEVIEQQQCFALKDLAVDGRDLIAVGVPQGTAIGKWLNRLMDMVIDEQVENDKGKLLKIVQEKKEI